MPRRRRHYRITLRDAYEAHDEALTFGGLPGVLDAGRIEAAIARPYSGYHRSIASKAAALFEAVANNHGFSDGQKRTAIYLTYLLIRRSGYRLEAAEAGENLGAALEALALSVAKGELRLPAITEWFARRLIRSSIAGRIQGRAHTRKRPR